MASQPSHRPRIVVAFAREVHAYPKKFMPIRVSLSATARSGPLWLTRCGRHLPDVVRALGDRVRRQPRPWQDGLQGVHRIRRRPGLSRSSDHRRRRLPGHRCAHPAPQTENPTTPECRARGREQGSPHSTCPLRAHPVPPEELEDPAGLPAQGQRRPPGHGRHRPTSRSCWMLGSAMFTDESSSTCNSRAGALTSGGTISHRCLAPVP